MVTGPTGARRFSAGTERVCARANCGALATTTLRFAPSEHEAWLVELDDAEARTEGDLCARHARVVALPSGWALHDGRGANATAVPQPRRPALRTRHIELVVVRERQPDDPPVVAASVDLVLDALDEESAALTEERLEDQSVAGEPLSEVLDAQTPLLKRAFQNVWPFATDDE
jgi:hypothetical protein